MHIVLFTLSPAYGVTPLDLLPSLPLTFGWLALILRMTWLWPYLSADGTH